MVFCNPVPIANSCSLDKETTQDALNAFARAVADLTAKGKTLDISLNIIKIRIAGKNMTYSYNKQFESSLNTINYEKEMKKSLKETKAHWTQSYENKWNQSTLGSLIQKPQAEEVNQIY